MQELCSWSRAFHSCLPTVSLLSKQLEWSFSKCSQIMSSFPQNPLMASHCVYKRPQSPCHALGGSPWPASYCPVASCCSQTTPCLFSLQGFCSHVWLTPFFESGLCSNSISPGRSPWLFYFKEPPLPELQPHPQLSSFTNSKSTVVSPKNQPPALYLIMKPRGQSVGRLPLQKTPSIFFPRRKERRLFWEAVPNLGEAIHNCPSFKGFVGLLGVLPCPREEAVKRKQIPYNLCV